ncbi:MAG: metal-dependent hydrolase [Cyclobacteriaceae bacterium]|nr:metal-dependent hydrolase [Cyclobacteriaceae bacterium SS2]
MDSLTQIVLGAAVGEAVLGRKVGNKALLYGAIAGTIPDLDVLASHFTDTSKALAFHRGFTHSIVFSVLCAPLLAWLVSRYEKYKDIKGWTWLFFGALVTHPMLDAFTTWGTQLFWPLDLRLAFKTIFVIDPLYTVPFLACVILTMTQQRTAPKRLIYNRLGLILSSSYLLITILLKGYTYFQFKGALETQNIRYLHLDTRPSPLNTVLWSANVETEEAYLLGTYSLFDTKPIVFQEYPKNHHLLGPLVHDEKVQRMIRISEGWYIISEEDGDLYFNDLRFGLLTFEPRSKDFVFKYKITTHDSGLVELTEVDKNPRDGRKLMGDLWMRVKGN